MYILVRFCRHQHHSHRHQHQWFQGLFEHIDRWMVGWMDEWASEWVNVGFNIRLWIDGWQYCLIIHTVCAYMELHTNTHTHTRTLHVLVIIFCSSEMWNSYDFWLNPTDPKCTFMCPHYYVMTSHRDIYINSPVLLIKRHTYVLMNMNKVYPARHCRVHAIINNTLTLVLY